MSKMNFARLQTNLHVYTFYKKYANVSLTKHKTRLNPL